MSREEIMDDLHEPQQENHELEKFIDSIREYYKTHEFKGAKFFDCNASTSEEPTNQLPPHKKEIIYKQDAIDALKELTEREEAYVDPFESVFKMLDDLPSAQPQWIPCSERLPKDQTSKDQTYVLVSTLDNDVQEAHLDGEGRFRDYFGDKVKCVVAWMPLPEPYKERQG